MLYILCIVFFWIFNGLCIGDGKTVDSYYHNSLQPNSERKENVTSLETKTPDPVLTEFVYPQGLSEVSPLLTRAQVAQARKELKKKNSSSNQTASRFRAAPSSLLTNEDSDAQQQFPQQLALTYLTQLHNASMISQDEAHTSTTQQNRTSRILSLGSAMVTLVGVILYLVIKELAAGQFCPKK